MVLHTKSYRALSSQVALQVDFAALLNVSIRALLQVNTDCTKAEP